MANINYGGGAYVGRLDWTNKHRNPNRREGGKDKRKKEKKKGHPYLQRDPTKCASGVSQSEKWPTQGHPIWEAHVTVIIVIIIAYISTYLTRASLRPSCHWSRALRVAGKWSMAAIHTTTMNRKTIR